jgi:AcrR family transcriptional regulator
LRADARRNRDQLIAAATAIFAVSGLDVPMEAIAREAGVGVGTLYRRFPDRAELVAAVAAQNFQGVIRDIQEALDAEPTAWGALARLITHSQSLRLTVRISFLGRPSWYSVHAAPESRDLHTEMMTALDALIGRAQADGSVRADIGSGDALALLSLVLGTRPSDSDPAGQTMSDRAALLVLDGLRPNSGTTLPGAPVRMADLQIKLDSSS